MENDPFAIVDEIPRKVMTLFYLVDTSGSMSGAKIGALNTAVRETLPIIKEISENNSDSKIKISVLEFSSGCEWMYPAPKEVETFEWRDLQAGGLTSLGEAYDNLSQKLSHSHGFMMEATGSFAPVIILLSDGAPTDHPEYALDKLKSNNWFKVATKIAIAIGDDCIKQTLIDFTGNEEAVLTVHNVDELKKIIRMVSVLLLYVMGMVGILMSEAIKVLVLRPKSLKIKSLISLNLLLLKSLQVKKCSDSRSHKRP